MDEPLMTVEGENAVERFVYGAFVGSDGRLRVIWRFLLSLIVVVLGNFAAAAFASLVGGRGRLFELIYRPLALILVLAGFWLLLKLADGVLGNPLPSMGLALRKPWLRDAAWGSLLGFVLISIAYLVIRFTCALTVNINFGRRTGRLVIAELVILATAAMLEEVMFRGYPFQRLVEMFEGAGRFICGKLLTGTTAQCSTGAFAAWTASVVWSAAFGAAHFGNPNASIWSFLNTALVGVLFCITYLRTRSLWMPWGIHFAWNATLGLVLGLPVSGVKQFSVIVVSRADGPLWITGGAYGIEASALGTAVIVIGIILAIVFVKPRQITTTVQNTVAVMDENRPEGIQL